MKGIDYSHIPSSGLRLTLSRWSNAFGGKGKGSRKGVEKGQIRLDAAQIHCKWEAAFDEFGPIRFAIKASISRTGSKLSLQESDWKDTSRNARVKGRVSLNGKPKWLYGVTDAINDESIEIPFPPEALPTTFQRFIPLLMKRKTGESVSFSSIPEDAFPWWRPRVKGSFFPLDGSPSPKEIRCVGTDELRRGRETQAGWAFEQVGKEGVERWWLVSDSGDLLAMAWKKTLWLPEKPSLVRAELSTKKGE